jgi:UDP-glucose 4-epimerase
VREVIAVAKEISGRDIPTEVGERRPGDPPSLVASPKRAEKLLGWKAQRAKLADIVRDAWKWHARPVASSHTAK